MQRTQKSSVLKDSKQSILHPSSNTPSFLQKRFFAAIPQIRHSLDSRILPVIRSRIQSVVNTERSEAAPRTNRSNFLLPVKGHNKSQRTIEYIEEEEEVVLQTKKPQKEPDIDLNKLKFLKYKFQPSSGAVKNADEDYGQYKKYRTYATMAEIMKNRFVHIYHTKNTKTFKDLFNQKHF